MIINIIEILLFLICILFSVPFLTLPERKQLPYMQRRIGLNYVGWYGILQLFPDPIKLLVKEILILKEPNKLIFLLSLMITLITPLLGWLVLLFGLSLTLNDSNIGILFSLPIGSLGVFGSLLPGWGSNNKYPFLGSIRSTPPLISYELVLTTVYIIILIFNSSLNYTEIINNQKVIYNIILLLLIIILFFMSTVFETNRLLPDLVEPENELVPGFFTEYSPGLFVFFFLGEYCNVIIMSPPNVILFCGGYLSIILMNWFIDSNLTIINPLIEGIIYGISFGFKLCIFMYLFIWIRPPFLRFTFDYLIKLCWTIFLLMLFSIFILILTMLYLFNGFLI